MASSTFRGPVRAGNLKDATLPGTGTVILSKAKAYTFADSATTNAFVIPASAIPLRFYVNNAVTFDASVGGLNIGLPTSVAFFVANMTMTSLGRLDCPLVTAGVSVMSSFASVDTTIVYNLSADASGASSGSGILFMDYVMELKS